MAALYSRFSRDPICGKLLAEGQVDYGVIHHIPDWSQALHEITRVLKPGGVFYFEDLLKGFISAWPTRALFDHPQATQFTSRAFRTGLAAAGLQVQQWRQWGELGFMGQARKLEGYNEYPYSMEISLAEK